MTSTGFFETKKLKSYESLPHRLARVFGSLYEIKRGASLTTFCFLLPILAREILSRRRRRKEGKSAFKTIRGDSVCLEERARCIFGIGFTKFDRSQQRSIRNLSKQ